MTKCSVVVTNKYKFKESFSLLNRQKLQKPMCIVGDRYNETGIIYCSTDESINLVHHSGCLFGHLCKESSKNAYSLTQ